MRYLPRTRRWGALAATLLVAGCPTICPIPPKTYGPIDKWLTCEECTNGERNAVKALGEDAVPTLARYLKEGPDAKRRAIMEQKLRANYRAHPGTGGVSEAEYVANLLGNYVATYQKRSAVSLGDIGTADARKALDEAATRGGYRADVVRVIQFIRSDYTTTRFPGTVSPAVVAFGDTINLTPPAGQTFNANTVLALDGLAPVFSDVVLLRQPNRIALAAVGQSGGHVLELRPPGTAIPQSVSITIRTATDANDRSTRSCADIDTTCIRNRAPSVPPAAFPFTTFLSLWRAGSNDTLDYFKVQAPSAIPITARLDWSDSSNLDLSWRNCLSFAEEGNLNGATSQKPETTSVTIPPSECWFLLIKLRSAASTEPIFARLRLTSP